MLQFLFRTLSILNVSKSISHPNDDIGLRGDLRGSLMQISKTAGACE